MNQSFNICGAGAAAQRNKMEVIANNLANVNTSGYKYQSANFSDLMYNNIHENNEEVSLKKEAGSRISDTMFNFTNGSYTTTNVSYQYAIEGDGFFAVENPQHGEVSYTRDGKFKAQLIGEDIYLQTADGDYVLDENMDRIVLEETRNEVSNKPVLVKFENRVGMQAIGGNKFIPVERNGQPIIDTSSKLVSGSIENSNVDVAKQMTEIIEAQRMFQLNLRMVTVSDEIQQTINSFR